MKKDIIEITTIECSYFDDNNCEQYKVVKNQNIHSSIAGTKFYIDPETLLKELSIGTKVKLKAEPTNPYDSHAIAILFRDKNIGYIPKKDIPIITINIPETGGEAYICKLENKLIGISIKATFERLNSKIAKEFGSFYFYKNTTKYTKEGEITRHQMLKQEEFIKLVNEQTLIIY